MKTLLLLSCFFGLIGGLFGQQPTFSWGPSQELSRDLPIKKLLASDTGSFFVLRSGKDDLGLPEDFQLEIFSLKSLERQSKIDLFLPKVEIQTVTYENLIWFNGQLWFFASGYQKSVKRNRAYLYPITSKGIQQDLALDVGVIKAIGLKQRGAFRYATSPDSSLILFAGSEDLESSYSEELSLRLLNASGQLVIADTLELPHKRERFRLQELKLGNRGEIIALGKVIDTDRGWSRGNPNFYFTLIVYEPKFKQLKEFKIDLPERSVSGVTAQLAENGDIVVTGFYSNLASNPTEVGGTFFLRLDSERRTLVGRHFQDLDNSVRLQLMNEKQVARGKEPGNFYFRHVGLRNNGSVIMVAEQYYKREVCTTDPQTGTTNCNMHYYFNDLLLAALDSTGKPEWNRAIFKSQYSINDNGGPYGSYLFGLEPDQCWVVFNDHPKNEKLVQDRNGLRYMSNPRRSVVRAVFLTQEGMESRALLFSNGNSDFTFAPQTFLNLSDSEMVIYGRGRKEFAFGRLRFDR